MESDSDASAVIKIAGLLCHFLYSAVRLSMLEKTNECKISFQCLFQIYALL